MSGAGVRHRPVREPGETVSGAPGVTVSGAPGVTVSGAPGVTVSGAPGVTVSGAAVNRELRFHRQRESNVTVSADGLTATLMNVSRDLDTAVVASCQPLHNDELFEFRIDRVIETWSASLEAGMCLL